MATTTYSFKSVGTTQTQAKQNTVTTSSLPIGVVTPPRSAPDGSLMQLTYSLSDQIKYNLHDLLLTNWGERLCLYDFGANLKPLCAEFQTQEDFDSAAMERIRAAIAKWMPYIELEDYSAEFIDRPMITKNCTYIPRQVKITIFYSVSQLNILRRGVEITLNVL